MTRPARWPAVVFAVVAVIVVGVTVFVSLHRLALSQGDLYRQLIFFHLFARYDYPAAWVTAATLLVAWPLSRLVRTDRLVGWIGAHPGIVALVTFVTLAIVARLAYQDYPLALDEYQVVFQSKIFAAGHLYAKYPPELVRRLLPLPGEFIRYSPVTGQGIEANWPVFALLMTPFSFIGASWLLNPLIGAMTVPLVGYVARKLLPEQPLAAGWAMLLTVASPAVTIDAISYYTMSAHLLVALAFTALLMEVTPGRVLCAALVGSLGLCLNNPIPQTLYALPWIVWLLWRPGRGRNFVMLVLGYLPTILIAGGWLYIQSRLPQAPVVAQSAPAHPEAFLARLSEELHNGALGLPNAQTWEAHGLWWVKLYLWAVPGLVVLALFGWRSVRRDTRAQLIAISALLSAFIYVVFIHVDQGHGWGARYFHPIWGILPLFAAAWLTRDPEGARWGRYVGLLAVGSLLLLTPQRFWQVHQFISEARHMMPPTDSGRSQMVFVNKHPRPGRLYFYAGDAVRNDPFLNETTITLDSQGDDRDAALVTGLYPGAQLATKTIHGTVWNLP